MQEKSKELSKKVWKKKSKVLGKKKYVMKVANNNQESAFEKQQKTRQVYMQEK